MVRRVEVFETADGRRPFSESIEAIRDRLAVGKIRIRVRRATLGNLGSHRGVGEGVVELRIDFGPGYRVYIGLEGDELIVLLCAGDKASQDKDIARAREYWREHRRRR
jgi:putative addiction module killer protein